MDLTSFSGRLSTAIEDFRERIDIPCILEGRYCTLETSYLDYQVTVRFSESAQLVIKSEGFEEAEFNLRVNYNDRSDQSSKPAEKCRSDAINNEPLKPRKRESTFEPFGCE